MVSLCSIKGNNKKETPNYLQLQLTEKNLYLRDFRNEVKNKIKNSQKQSTRFSDALKGIEINVQSAHDALEDPITRSLLDSGQQFDLFILGWSFNDFLLGLAAHFKCPSIVLHTVATTKTIRDFVASPAAFQSNYASGIVHGQTEITYWKRILFFCEHVIEFVMVHFYDHFSLRPYYNRHFPATKGYPSFGDVKKNVSLVFVGHHFSQGGIRPSVPNLVEIGGIQIKSKSDPLPQNIEEFFTDTNDHGVILFSLGTNINSADFSPEKLTSILNVFSSIDQKVIWKWDGDEIPLNTPKNVLMEEWIPQADILAHPNIRLFVSHCGLGSVTEAMYHAVPILGIPFIYDQHINAVKIAEEGWAIHLPYDNITTESFSSAVQEMLTNQTYALRVKHLSTLYKDRPQTALETAVYWTEYVIRHRGAAHMQFPLVHMNFVQQNSLDVLLFYVAAVFLLYKICKKLLQKRSLWIIFVAFFNIDTVFDWADIDISMY
ncbi:UDP-glycosyltransferase UGT4-like isoform X2 [Bradysia coprophila]|nr:UDP-glycosyltransferase UGT4-like isoform X2 [Bradysia coprophila]